MLRKEIDLLEEKILLSYAIKKYFLFALLESKENCYYNYFVLVVNLYTFEHTYISLANNFGYYTSDIAVEHVSGTYKILLYSKSLGITRNFCLALTLRHGTPNILKEYHFGKSYEEFSNTGTIVETENYYIETLVDFGLDFEFIGNKIVLGAPEKNKYPMFNKNLYFDIMIYCSD